MCVLYVSFASNVRPRTLGCIVMCSAVLFIFKLTYGCVVSVYCVGFASLDVVCDELFDFGWNVGL